MSEIIFCTKLNKEAAAMKKAPFPGKLGERIKENISQEAWSMWLSHQTILINEYRLNLLDPEARKFLNQELEKFLFGEGSEKPDAYTPE